MRIVQSFWPVSGKIHENGFGWITPEHNLMAWAFSCLKLSEFYDDLHLVTDSKAADVLIEQLGLPYKTVSYAFDGIKAIDTKFWCYAKLLAYASQSVPFIHVDGDVFVFEKLPSSLEKAGLIVQNLEVATNYYKQLIGHELKYAVGIPGYVDREFKVGTTMSVNAGIFGGCNLSFIKSYTDEALNLVETNSRSASCEMLTPCANILFEQVLFYALCKRDQKQITPYYNELIADNGYGNSKFADFTLTPSGLKYLHIIGNKKKDKGTCDMLSRALLTEYPECHFKITSLFRQKHYFFSDLAFFYSKESSQRTCAPFFNNYKQVELSVENYLNLRRDIIKLRFSNQGVWQHYINTFEQHGKFLEGICRDWSSVTIEDMARMSMNDSYRKFFQAEKECQEGVMLKAHPYLQITEDSFNWSREFKEIINNNLIDAANLNLKGLAYVPSVFYAGFEELVIDEFEYNILAVLQESTSFGNLILTLTACFSTHVNPQSAEAIYDLCILKLKHLFTIMAVEIIENDCTTDET